MSFDARSLERLQELGRSLPKPLPKPETSVEPKRASANANRIARAILENDQIQR